MFNWQSLLIATAVAAGTATASAATFTPAGATIGEAQATPQVVTPFPYPRPQYIVYNDWACDGSIDSDFRIYIYHYDQPGNHRFRTSDGRSGKWTSDGQNVVFTFRDGTAYTGSDDPATGLPAGTMFTPAGQTGCWTSEPIFYPANLGTNAAAQ